MASNTALLNSTVLSPQAKRSPQEIEQNKTRQERAEDIIYLTNHTVTCLGFTDMFGLSMMANASNNIAKLFTGKKGTLSLDHDHDHGYGFWTWVKDKFSGKYKDEAYVKEIHQSENERIEKAHHHAHEHESHDHAHGKKPSIHPDPVAKLTPDASGKDAAKKYWNTSKRWLFAEAIGDVGSVPFTLFLQHHAPGFMQSIRDKIIEPVAGGLFHKNMKRAATKWGQAHGFAADSQEVKNRADELYEYEMRHLPQMAVWTVSSIGLNFAAMEMFHKLDPRQYERNTLKEFTQVKGGGALMTAAVVLGLRGLIPGGAHKWDQTVGKNVVIPIVKMFGVKSEEVDQYQKNRDQNSVEAAAGEINPVPLNASKPRTTVEGGTAQHTTLQPQQTALSA